VGKSGRAMSFIKNQITQRPLIDKTNVRAAGPASGMCPVEPKAVDWDKGNKTQPPRHNMTAASAAIVAGNLSGRRHLDCQSVVGQIVCPPSACRERIKKFGCHVSAADYIAVLYKPLDLLYFGYPAR